MRTRVRTTSRRCAFRADPPDMTKGDAVRVDDIPPSSGSGQVSRGP
uniref:Uncharacterized protein n=1 Tax=Janibacter limosus TaxID=53458 RepID=A0AC61U6Q9_9MICO|nr:hypothetical protein [Janibacter limosus]